MSAKELVLTTQQVTLKIETVLECFSVVLERDKVIYLDRNQAHLLYLYLKEHLE